MVDDVVDIGSRRDADEINADGALEPGERVSEY